MAYSWQKDKEHKEVLCAIFFSCDGVAIQVRCRRAKVSVSPWCFTKTAQEILSERRPVTGFQHVRLLHNNAPAHTSEILKLFLKSEDNCLATITVLSRTIITIRGTKQTDCFHSCAVEWVILYVCVKQLKYNMFKVNHPHLIPHTVLW